MPSSITYSHETVPLDGETFSDCEFRDSRLVYSGGEPPVFSQCKFEACDWRYDDAAARTLAHMKVVWNAGGKTAVQALIKDITVAR